MVVTNLMKLLVLGCLVLVGVSFWGSMLKEEPKTPGAIAALLATAFTAFAPMLCSFSLMGILFRPDPRRERERERP